MNFISGMNVISRVEWEEIELHKWDERHFEHGMRGN
ncbi:hypothetical protein JOD29_003617 [Lysinibacillus composti]|nr:hypothetical protein [Lysinibacillus composti]